MHISEEKIANYTDHPWYLSSTKNPKKKREACLPTLGALKATEDEKKHNQQFLTNYRSCKCELKSKVEDYRLLTGDTGVTCSSVMLGTSSQIPPIHQGLSCHHDWSLPG
jgi:hypothetical protein